MSPLDHLEAEAIQVRAEAAELALLANAVVFRQAILSGRIARLTAALADRRLLATDLADRCEGSTDCEPIRSDRG